VMWILTNQQTAWCNALQLPSEKVLWNPFLETPSPSPNIIFAATLLGLLASDCLMHVTSHSTTGYYIISLVWLQDHPAMYDQGKQSVLAHGFCCVHTCW